MCSPPPEAAFHGQNLTKSSLPIGPASPRAKMGKLGSWFASTVSGIVLVHSEPGDKAGEMGRSVPVHPAPPTVPLRKVRDIR